MEQQADDFEIDGPEESPIVDEEAQETPEPAQEKPQEELKKGEKSYLARQKLIAEQAKAEAKAAREELEALKAKQAEASLKPEPKIPEMPDQFDDDFADKVAAREAALQEKSKWEAERKQFEEERQRLEWQRQQQAAADQQREAQEREQLYRARIEASGLSEDDVAQSLMKVQQNFTYQDGMGNAHNFMPEPLREMLVEDEASPLVAKLISDNADIAAELATMSEYQARIHLLTEIRPRALALKPKSSSAPEPPDQLSGGGKVETESPAVRGATFE